MQFQQLLPRPVPVDIDERLESLAALRELAPADRPYALANFVASVDGRATFGGRSGPLGDDGDRAMFHGIRERVDAVIAGTRTLAHERYGRILGKPERRERRAARGLPPEPLACIVSRSGWIPVEIPLFAEPEAHVVVFTPKPPELGDCAARVDVHVVSGDQPPLTTAVRTLRHEYGTRTLLCEGGPTIFSAMLAEQLVDELFVTVAPKLTGGGTGPTISLGAELPEPWELTTEWLLERRGSLFHRYSLR
jgi:riboflavin biosynthesis pyrimidine reductase